MTPTITPQDFVAKWKQAALTERASAQPHFLDLCALLGVQNPAEADAAGTWYAFEKGAAKQGGGQGWADVWKQGSFAWEYKQKGRSLTAAYQQLLLYREALENPPLLVVSDIDTIEIHTNFTSSVKQVHTFVLDDLLDAKRRDLLRKAWVEPEAFRTGKTTEEVTQEVAREFARLAELLRERGAEPDHAAHFLIRLLFCLFAEDVGLLPNGLFSKLIEATLRKPPAFAAQLQQLFAAMRGGGYFGTDEIPHFDGGLFDDDTVFPLPRDGLEILSYVSKQDWSSIEPAIFGTLFERSLDPGKRSQLGAHYTSRDDILLIVEPVLMAPLRRRWSEVQAEALALHERRQGAIGGTRTKLENQLAGLLMGFAGEVAGVRVLDPAAGSGNFLYVALKQLLDLEKEVIVFTGELGLTRFFPSVSPEQLRGIEVNEYAHELAGTTVWIGYIQWLRDNGFGQPSEPILKPLDTIRQMDAILAYDEQGQPVEPEWPEADVIIGNPPFLGSQRMRSEMGDSYTEAVRRLYGDRLPGQSDLVCYWFEKTRALIAQRELQRAGLLATQGIRGGANRTVLERIKETGDIFWAQSDRDWILDGATVHVSMVCFDDGRETDKFLNGVQVGEIFADLTYGINLTHAPSLLENRGLAFQGPVKVGPFDIDEGVARAMLLLSNIHGRSNAEVMKPWVNASDLTGRNRRKFIIDFSEMSMEEAALFEAPFEYVRTTVKPMRDENKDKGRRTFWWRLGRSGSDLKAAKAGLQRVIGTPRVAKHRLFVWLDGETLPDTTVVVIGKEDDYFFGVLHSRIHESWARRQGTQLREAESGFRYTPTTTFETFPFPWPPGAEPADDPRVQAIAAAARDLVLKRDAWLNPPGATEQELKKRTLTNLYNDSPMWLEMAHRKLDHVVLDAYGWSHDLSDEEILERLLALNLERAGK